MTPFRFEHITWNDVITFLINTSGRPKEPKDIYIWTKFATPDNDEKPFDRNAFFEYLLMECGNFEALWPNVELLITRVSAWSISRLPYWQRIYDVLCLDYNPIWNYNRYDEDSTNTKRDTGREIGVESEQDNLAKVAGYDSGELVEDSKVNGNQTAKENYDEDMNEDWVRNNHSYGNIGVTTTQQMIEQEIQIAQHSMYDIILQEFKETFCLAIYS